MISSWGGVVLSDFSLIRAILSYIDNLASQNLLDLHFYVTSQCLMQMLFCYLYCKFNNLALIVLDISGFSFSGCRLAVFSLCCSCF
jgi:hypothetical protein